MRSFSRPSAEDILKPYMCHFDLRQPAKNRPNFSPKNFGAVQQPCKTLGKLTTFFVCPLDWSFSRIQFALFGLVGRAHLDTITVSNGQGLPHLHTTTPTSQHAQTRTHAHTIHSSNGVEVC